MRTERPGKKKALADLNKKYDYWFGIGTRKR